MQKLTKELFYSLTASQIYYAEIASTGAMGNRGGIIIYAISLRDKVLTRYETNLKEDEMLYDLVWGFFQHHIKKKSNIYLSYYGGFGNQVYLNSSLKIEIKSDHFELRDNTGSYPVKASVTGVFEKVKGLLLNEKKNEKL